MTNSALTQLNLYKEKHYELKTIQLTSPILHIGSEVARLNPFEYVETSSKVYLPNAEALAQMLQKKGGNFLKDYIEAIENKESIAKLLKQAFGEDWQNIKSPNGLAIFPEVRPKWTQQENQFISDSDLRPAIRNGMGQLYIPGSSIKGAIRTAIAYYLLKHADCYQIPSQCRVSEIEKRLREKLDDEQIARSKKKEYFNDKSFMDKLFSNFSLYYQDKNFNPKSAQNTDFLRAVKVSDSQPLVRKIVTLKDGKKVGENLPMVAEVIISSHFEDWKAKYKTSIYAEMIYNVNTKFTISLDTEMLSWFHHRQGMKLPFQNLDELLKICQEFAKKQWDGEVRYWQNIVNNRHQGKNLDFDLVWDKFYAEPQCPYSLRIGWGVGMNGVTIDWLLQDDIRSELRDVCGIAAPNFEAPKSRRTIVNSKGEIRYVPGWVKFKSL